MVVPRGTHPVDLRVLDCGVHLHPETISPLNLLIHTVISVLCTEGTLKKLSQPSQL